MYVLEKNRGAIVSEPPRDIRSLAYKPGADRLGYISGYMGEFIEFFGKEERIDEYAKIIAKWLDNNIVTYKELFLTHGQELETDGLSLKYDINIPKFADIIFSTEHEDGSGPLEYNLPAYHKDNPLVQLLLHYSFNIRDYEDVENCYGSHYHIRYYHPRYYYVEEEYRSMLTKAGIVLANHASKLLSAWPDEWGVYYDYYSDCYCSCRLKWADPENWGDKYSAFYSNYLSNSVRTIENRLCENNTVSCYYFALIWHNNLGKLAKQYRNECDTILANQIDSGRPAWDEEFMSEYELPQLQLPLTPVRVDLDYNDMFPGEQFLLSYFDRRTVYNFLDTYIRLIDRIIGYTTNWHRLFKKDPKNLPIILFL